jgi:hypothetical protein
MRWVGWVYWGLEEDRLVCLRRLTRLSPRGFECWPAPGRPAGRFKGPLALSVQGLRLVGQGWLTGRWTLLCHVICCATFMGALNQVLGADPCIPIKAPGTGQAGGVGERCGWGVWVDALLPGERVYLFFSIFSFASPLN